MLHFWGETRVTAGSDALPRGGECEAESSHRHQRDPVPLEAGLLGSNPSPPPTCRIIAGNLPISKQMETNTMVPSAIAASAQDKGQSA